MYLTPIRNDRTPARPHARAATAAPKVPTPDDVDLAARQSAFDRMLKERAELEREANAISQLTVQQAKRDDELMQAWIKLI